MEKRSEYLIKFDKKLAEYDAKLTALKTKASEVRSDIKAECLSQVESLEKGRDAFVVRYEKLKDSNGHAWDDMKGGTEKAWGDLERSFGKALSRFK